MKLSAVILAGGQSTRMGRDKAWLELDGQPLISRAAETARGIGIKELFVSGHAAVDYSRLNCPVLLDLEPGFGPLGGIERALHHVASPLLLVLAVDLPYMTGEFLQKLYECCDAQTGVVPELNGKLEPLAAIYPKHCHRIAAEFLAQRRHSAREFAAVCVEQNAVKAFPVAPADAPCFMNWNCPADRTAPAHSESTSNPMIR